MEVIKICKKGKVFILLAIALSIAGSALSATRKIPPLFLSENTLATYVYTYDDRGIYMDGEPFNTATEECPHAPITHGHKRMSPTEARIKEITKELEKIEAKAPHESTTEASGVEVSTESAYRPNIAEKVLGVGHAVRKDMESSTWEKITGFFSSIGSTTKSIGSAIFSPLQFLKEQTTGFMQRKIRPWIKNILLLLDFQSNGPPESPEEAQMREQRADQDALCFTQVATICPAKFAGWILEKIANQFMKIAIGSDYFNDLKEECFAPHELATRRGNLGVQDLKEIEQTCKQDYENKVKELMLDKDRLTKILFEQYEGENGAMYERYQQGLGYYETAATIYCTGQKIYDLVDNITTIPSLIYQLTDASQANHESMIPKRSTPAKIMLVTSILHRCIKSYMDIAQLRDPSKRNHENLSGLEKMMSWFLGIARYVLPLHKYVTRQKIDERAAARPAMGQQSAQASPLGNMTPEQQEQLQELFAQLARAQEEHISEVSLQRARQQKREATAPSGQQHAQSQCVRPDQLQPSGEHHQEETTSPDA